jgi:hypothetical protein
MIWTIGANILSSTHAFWLEAVGDQQNLETIAVAYAWQPVLRSTSWPMHAGDAIQQLARICAASLCDFADKRDLQNPKLRPNRRMGFA